MYFKGRKLLVWLLAITFLFTQLIGTGPLFAQTAETTSNITSNIAATTGTGTDRISGADRYKTAVAVSQKGWKTSDYAVLARGDQFADALCAGPLAQKFGGPILLTAPKSLNSDTLKELQRLGVKHLFITGGIGAISQSVEDELKSYGINTVERIFGDDRYQTAVKIAEKIGSTTKAVLATGSDFPDALSISGIAAKEGMPILLTAKNSLPKQVEGYLKTKAITQTYVIGGTGVISTEVANKVPSPIRLAGNDRYETNRVIMENFADKLNFDSIYVTVGSGFADALTGAVLAAKTSSPLVLTGKSLPVNTANYLQSKLKLTSKIKGLGGKNVVSSTILTDLIAAKENLTVAEKYSAAGTYGPETGSQKIQGNVIISSRDVNLRNMIIEGDLLLGHSIGNGNVELNNVTVQGKTIINGGGPNSVIMYNFNGQNIIVDVPDGSSVRLVAQGSTTVGTVTLESNGRLEESGLTGSGFTAVEIPAGAEVVLAGDFDQVNVEASGASVDVRSGTVTTMNINPTAVGAGVNLAQAAKVNTFNANAGVNVTGQGQITNANVNVNGVTIQQTPTNTTVAAGLTANIGGEVQSGTTQPVAPPAGGGGVGGGGPITPPSAVSAITVTTTPVQTSDLDYDAGLIMVSLATTTPEARIYYTTNGNTPTESSTLYTVPFTVSNTKGMAGDTVTVKAIAVKTGLSNSAIAQRAVVYKAATAVTVYNVDQLKEAIRTNSVKTITLGGDIVGDVTETRLGTNGFTIDFGTHVLSGNLNLTADNVPDITFRGSAVPAVTRDLTLSAEKATVTNGINIGGTIKVSKVSGHSWIEEADGNTITLTNTSTGARIVITGNPEDITVEDGASGINITANSPVSINVSSGAAVNSITAEAPGTIITNNGSVSNVTANADVAIENNNGDIAVAGTGTVGTSGTAGANVTGTAKIVTGITDLNIDQSELRIGGTTAANITTTISNDSYNVTSANSSIVSVNTPTGLAITALKPGKAAITVQVKDSQGDVTHQGTIFVTVLPQLIATASATITAPVLGVTPQTAAQAETATAKADYTVTGLTWKPALTAEGKFKAGETYTATVVLTSKNNKAFQEAALTPTVAGSASVGTSTTVGKNVGNRISFDVSFPATANSINIEGFDFIPESGVITGYTGTATDLTIPATLSHSGTDFEVKGIGSSAFKNNTTLTSVVIPDTVTDIYVNAFDGCANLASVTFGSNVAHIYSKAFANCTSLNNVTIPNMVTILETETFANCTGLTNIVFGSSLATISNRVFEGCTSLNNVILPTSLTLIGLDTFKNCTSLSNLTIRSNINGTSGGSFSGCTALTGVNFIPNTVTRIGNYLFQNHEALTSISIPETVTYIADMAFSGCTGLSSITIPNAVTTLRPYAFDGCINLSSVTFGSGLTAIPNYAFVSCGALESITIPATIISIGEMPFASYDGGSFTNEKLTSITIGADVTLADYLFYGEDRNSFVTTYNNGGKLAGTYTYSSGVWNKFAASTDATLSDLKVDGITILGFNPNILTYNVELLAGTTEAPVVTATVTDTGKASAVITPAASLPGLTIVAVTAEDGITTKTYTVSFTVDETIPALAQVTPARGPIPLGIDESFVLTVKAEDPYGLYELEIDHSMEATLPEFSVYADETNPYGTPEDKALFQAQGVNVSFNATAQEWTIDFGQTVTGAFVANGGITFYLVIKDIAGNQFGSMSPTIPANTFAYTFEGGSATMPFTPGEGGTLPSFTPFTAVANKIGGLYIEKNHDYYSMIYGDNPIYHHYVEMKFPPASEFGATGYTLQSSTDSGVTWVDYPLDTEYYPGGIIGDTQDNIGPTNPGQTTMYRLLVIGGPKDGYTSNVVTAEVPVIKTQFSSWSLDESMDITGVMVPWVGRGLRASFTAKVSDYPSTDTSYKDEHMTYQWYRVNPASYEMTAISGATNLTYTTTEEDVGYMLLIRATGDDIAISGFAQIISNWSICLHNNAYVSNVSDTGFTLNLYKNVSGLTASDLELRDNNGDPVTITSVVQGENAAIYNISATLDPAKGPFMLTNTSDFWRLTSEVTGGHGMFMPDIQVSF